VPFLRTRHALMVLVAVPFSCLVLAAEPDVPRTPRVTLRIVTVLEPSAEGEKVRSVRTDLDFYDGKEMRRLERDGFIVLNRLGEAGLTDRMFRDPGSEFFEFPAENSGSVRVVGPSFDVHQESPLRKTAPDARQPLGTRIIHGVEAVGYRSTVEIPAGQPSEKPVVLTIDTWRNASDVRLRQRESTSLGPEVTVTDFYYFSVEELPAALFAVPAGAKLVASSARPASD
jgi:hypothetical protein